MSYMRILSMILVVGMLVPVLQAAEEKPRVWTSATGKKLTGVMKEYGDDWVKVEVKGKVYKLPLSKLSKADQEYVEELKSAIRVTPKVEAVPDDDLDLDVRYLSLDIKNVPEDDEIYILVVWIAKNRLEKYEYIKSHIESSISEDGTEKFEKAFSNHPEGGDKYLGYAVRLINQEGKVVKELSSSKKMLPYLDQANARQAPKPAKTKGEEKEGEAEEKKDE